MPEDYVVRESRDGGPWVESYRGPDLDEATRQFKRAKSNAVGVMQAGVFYKAVIQIAMGDGSYVAQEDTLG